MKSLALALSLTASAVSATECPTFTYAQERSLNLAYAVGLPHDLGYTLAAITWQESFVGRYIVRVNPKDGKYGSYGLTHINLETAMWIEGIDSSWEARDKVVSKLFDPFHGDQYSLELSVKKLMTTHNSNWLEWWTSYNGNNPQYGLKIQEKVKALKHCGVFSY